ncbi:MAG: hypothetical protein MHMPM18_001885 [Marteilia pararefringens]
MNFFVILILKTKESSEDESSLDKSEINNIKIRNQDECPIHDLRNTQIFATKISQNVANKDLYLSIDDIKPDVQKQNEFKTIEDHTDSGQSDNLLKQSSQVETKENATNQNVSSISNNLQHMNNNKDEIESGDKKKQKMNAAQMIRQTTVWDYKLDICKDHKETGYCGYGDSCKFIHDRSDYKPGWLIEKEFEDAKKGDAFDEEDGDENKYLVSSSESEEQLICEICNQDLYTDINDDSNNNRTAAKQVVSTRCQHLFHEDCILKYFRCTTKCKVCRSETSGMLKPK